jgi:hypothetical protein
METVCIRGGLLTHLGETQTDTETDRGRESDAVTRHARHQVTEGEHADSITLRGRPRPPRPRPTPLARQRCS